MQLITYLTLAASLTAATVARGPVFGTFDTTEVRPWNVPGTNASKLVNFPPAFGSPPSIATGLMQLDVSNAANIRVNAFATNVTLENAELHLDTWADTRLYSAISAWYAVGADEPYIQTGRFATTDDHPWNRPQQNTSKRIYFSPSYSAPPKVVVWLTALDMERGRNWRVAATATDISTTGFTIHINTWADSILWSAAASWVAYPSNSKEIFSGSFRTLDVRGWQTPQLLTSGRTGFPAGFFKHTPTVLYALNAIDIGHNANLRIKASASSQSRNGWTWHLDGWSNSIIYAAGGDFLAIA